MFKFSKLMDSLQSKDPAGMKLNPITLSFVEGDENLEGEFREYYYRISLKIIRTIILVGLFSFAIFGAIVDPLYEKKLWLWLFRFGIACPTFLFVFVFTFFSLFKKYMQFFLFVFLIISSTLLFILFEIDPTKPCITNPYDIGPCDDFGSVILLLFGGLTLLRLRFVWATLSCWILLIIYAFVIYFRESTFFAMMFVVTHIFIANIIGMLVCYYTEYYIRADYYSGLQLKRVNKEQEQRTHELAILNQMSNSLNKCRTERETYDVIAAISQQLFPDDSGYMMVINNPGTKLEKIFSWGTSPTESQSTESQFADFDLCRCYREKIQINFDSDERCSNLNSSQLRNHICIPIIIERETIHGVFHLNLNQDKQKYSDEEYKRKTESDQALALRMVEQYALFLTNLRLRIIDPLTGLYNLIYIRENLDKEVSRFARTGIIMTDIDILKNINESYGNEAGDIVLQKFGELLKSNVRDEDTVCRYGGGEFMLILPELSHTEAGKKAEQLRKMIADDFRPEYDENILKITASFGVANFPDHGSDISSVITAASKALQRAKKGGMNRIVAI